jgi:thiol-disulfide isomerase/thioredoxin
MVVYGIVIKRLIILAAAVIVLVGIGVFQVRTRTRSGQPTATPPLIMVAPTSAATPQAALTFVAPPPRRTTTAPDNLAPYPVYGPGAELRDDVWLNSPAPLRLADLRGRVVLLSFWAFDCLPCLPVLANLRTWYSTYNSHGLTVIGVHYPKIDAERSYDGLVAALTRLNVPYPVAQDNDGLIWHAYGQQVWPTLTLIDKRGYLRYQQVGAGGYDAMETAIRALLAEGA